MKIQDLHLALPLIRAFRKSRNLASFAMCMLFAGDALAQNPTFAGKEFRRVWVDTSLPTGAPTVPYIVGATDLHLTAAGVFMNSTVYGTGLYYIDDSGGYTVATKSQPEFSSAGFFRVIGAKADGSMIFCPAVNNNIYPCQLYGAGGLSALASPTPEQQLSLGNYFDGRYAYLEHLGLGAVQIGYYTEGNPADIWLDNSDFADLATILDYDGDTLAFVTGTTGSFDVRLREADGTLKYIIGMGDPLPGTASSTMTGTPSAETTEVDQGTVYIQSAGSGGEQILFSSSDGVTFNVIAEVGQAVPGLTGVTITGMTLKQVRDGKIWMQVAQSNGDNVLYQIVGGTWMRVAGKLDMYDGGSPVGFNTYEHGILGDSAVVVVTYLDFSSPTIYRNEVYVNAGLPGFSAAPSGMAMQIIRELNGDLTISATGDPGGTNTLQGTSSLTNMVWDTIGTVIADGAGLMQWTLSPTNNVRFFRFVE